MDLDTLLNKNQKEAATYLDSHLRIIAGAGSGKTRVVTYRIAHLIQDVGIDPRSILAITFTNKAANEMKERVNEVVGIHGSGTLICTIHSLCVRFLRQHINVLNYPSNFTIMDEEDQKALIKKLYTQLEIDAKVISIKSMINTISSYKTARVSPQRAIELAGQFSGELKKAKVYEAYENYKEDHFLLDFDDLLLKNAHDKFVRTLVNYDKKPFSDQDLKENLITGFASGYYMYFRKVFNDINLGKISNQSMQYQAANFYFIREYCYGSMFRYNSKGEFNIPYGGMSYNKKNMKSKIDNMFNREIDTLFSNTDIHCSDFENFFKDIKLTEKDFVFLDPPYDTDFSDYEGKDFTKNDQERLAYSLKKTLAKFILVIKNTDFISNLYDKDFNILSFDKQYTYNVRSRNNRDVEHLIITNLPV